MEEGKGKYEPEKKKEHFVPRFYLDNFSDNKGQLWVYNLEKNKYYPEIAKNICYKKYLYETRWPESEKTVSNKEIFINFNYIENIFAENEGRYSAVIKKIINICSEPKNKDALICYGEEKRILAEFAANLFVRNPIIMDQAIKDIKKDIDDLEEVRAAKKFLDENTDSTTLNCFNAMLEELFKKYWLLKLEDKTEDFLQMNFVFYQASDGEFITSDYPILPVPSEDKTHFIEFSLPLSPKIVLCYGYFNDPELKNHRNKLLTTLNGFVAQFNKKYLSDVLGSVQLISGSKAQLKNTVARA